jgi:hypothetical protein
MMQSEKPKLTIHTTMNGEPPAQKTESTAQTVAWAVLPKKPRRIRFLPVRARTSGGGRTARRVRAKLTAGEKLLRNAAIACALLLTLLALKNVDQPWTRQAADGIRRAVTMRIDLDESLGRLNFVREMVPDTALVFWNMGAKNRVMQPVAGEVSHEFDAQQPWVEYACAGSEDVYAVDAGRVTAVTQSAAGDFSVLVDHEGGAQSVYAFMNRALVRVGQTVELGERLGATSESENSRLYFEYRVNGVAKDPRAFADGAQ